MQRPEQSDNIPDVPVLPQPEAHCPFTGDEHVVIIVAPLLVTVSGTQVGEHELMYPLVNVMLQKFKLN